ncbi:hypothetical protein E2C01_056123 [Portunus trituberculatus]|uniref:Uncharacterized protein n=1 Tax=Portunus trituberculatus TaxID=210409 RepID=A0A5B7GWI7_PORTR|nr:hypothetical protein [Portunus trituberculatus]
MSVDLYEDRAGRVANTTKGKGSTRHSLQYVNGYENTSVTREIHGAGCTNSGVDKEKEHKWRKRREHGMRHHLNNTSTFQKRRDNLERMERQGKEKLRAWKGPLKLHENEVRLYNVSVKS